MSCAEVQTGFPSVEVGRGSIFPVSGNCQDLFPVQGILAAIDINSPSAIQCFLVSALTDTKQHWPTGTRYQFTFSVFASTVHLLTFGIEMNI